MARPLFRAPSAPPDTRPAILSVVSLMVILLPMLLMTTSARRLTGLPLSVAAPGDALPPLPPGPIEQLVVTVGADGYHVHADVRSTDVRAASGDVERRDLPAPDLGALQGVLRTLKGLDARRARITLVPSADTTTEQVVAWMDAVQRDNRGELFPEIVLRSVPVAAEAEVPAPDPAADPP